MSVPERQRLKRDLAICSPHIIDRRRSRAAVGSGLSDVDRFISYVVSASPVTTRASSNQG